MTVIRKVNISQIVGLTGYDLFCNYFKSCNYPAFVQPTYDDTSNIITLRINDDAELALNTNGTDGAFYLDGGQVSHGSYIVDNCHMLTICSDNVFYLKFQTLRYSTHSGMMFHYLYEVLDTGATVTAYNGWYDWNSQSAVWDNLKLHNIEIFQRGLEGEEQIKYTHKPMLNYRTKFKSIDYTSSYFTRGNTLTDIEDTNFLTCSNVASDSIVSFDGVNYYAADTNTLIDIDIDKEDEEEEYE